MDVYFPPIAAVTGGIVVVGLCFLLRIPIFLIGLLSVIVLIYTLTIHSNIFGFEYKTMNVPEFLKQNAPIFIILAVILISLGYILYLFGPKGAVQNASISNSSSSSNFLKSRDSERSRAYNTFGSRESRDSSNYRRINPYINRERRGIENELSRRI
jgi:hypothetical protein